jgi:hypothetical protein
VDLGNAVAQSVFNAARALFPPSTVVHLGAGSGQGTLHQWRQWDDVPSSLVVDTQANRLSWAQGWVNTGSGRLLSDATVSAADGQTVSLCHTSNPDETGLIGLPSLHFLWPQLRQIDSTGCQTRSLDSLISELVSAALSEEKNLWLLVDFFCAADFWMGASKALAHARVVVLRQTVKDIEGVEPAKATAHRMVDLGFVCCASLESNHPGVVHVVYLRGLAKDLEAAQTSNLALIQERYMQQRAKDEALEQRAQEAQAKEQALSQGETLAQEKAELLASLEAQQRAKDEAVEQRDLEAHAKAQALSERETLALEKVALLAALEASQRAIKDALAQRDFEAQAKEQALSQGKTLAQEKAELLASLEASQRAKDQALAQRNQESKAKDQALSQREALAQEKADLLTSRDAEAKARSQLQGKLDAESNAKAVLAQELAALEARFTSISAEKDTETKRKTELLAQRDILVQEKAGLAAAREFEMQAKSDAQGERDAKAKIISEQGDEMEKLRAEVAALRVDLEGAQLRAQTTENQNQNLHWRQDLLQDEMTKAEAQIDLIKDLLLREPKL